MTTDPTETAEQAVQILSNEGAQCGQCGDEPGDRACPDCEKCRRGYVSALIAAGWGPGPAAVPSAGGDLRDRIAQAAARLGHPQWDAAALAEAVGDELTAHAPTAVCICGHPERQHFEDSCITEITGCTCGDYLPPDAAAELIARLSQGARDNRAALSEALGLGSGAPWSAIRARAGDVDRLQQQVLELEAEQVKLRDLLASENKRANDAIDREEAAEQVATELRAVLDGYRCTDCGGEGGSSTEDPDVWAECQTCRGTGRHADRAAVLAEVVAWLTKKAGEYQGRGRRQDLVVAEAIITLASKVDRGAVRPDNLLGADLSLIEPAAPADRAAVLREAADQFERECPDAGGAMDLCMCHAAEPLRAWADEAQGGAS